MLIDIASFFAILTIAAVLNPSDKKHREAVQDYANKNHSDIFGQDNIRVYEEYSASRLNYHNCIFFSITTDPAFECMYGPPVKSIGAFGKVFVYPPPKGYVGNERVSAATLKQN